MNALTATNEAKARADSRANDEARIATMQAKRMQQVLTAIQSFPEQQWPRVVEHGLSWLLLLGLTFTNQQWKPLHKVNAHIDVDAVQLEEVFMQKRGHPKLLQKLEG
ncbi:hypothetical protein Tco_0128736 [Tanacetum coccineum]